MTSPSFDSAATLAFLCNLTKLAEEQEQAAAAPLGPTSASPPWQPQPARPGSTLALLRSLMELAEKQAQTKPAQTKPAFDPSSPPAHWPNLDTKSIGRPSPRLRRSRSGRPYRPARSAAAESYSINTLVASGQISRTNLWARIAAGEITIGNLAAKR